MTSKVLPEAAVPSQGFVDDGTPVDCGVTAENGANYTNNETGEPPVSYPPSRTVMLPDDVSDVSSAGSDNDENNDSSAFGDDTSCPSTDFDSGNQDGNQQRSKRLSVVSQLSGITDLGDTSIRDETPSYDVMFARKSFRRQRRPSIVDTRQLTVAERMIEKKFLQDFVDDKNERNNLIDRFEDFESRDYDWDESEILEDSKDWAMLFKQHMLKVNAVKLVSPLVSGEVGYDSQKNEMYGRTITKLNVKASALDVLAFLWDQGSKFNSMEPTRVLENKNPHNQVIHNVKNPPAPLRPREFLNRLIWKHDPIDDVYFLVYVPVNSHPKAPPNKMGHTTGKLTRVYTLTEDVPGECKVELCVKINFGSDVLPLWYITRKFFIPIALRGASDVQQYFAQLRTIDVLDVEDGKMLGVAFVCKAKYQPTKDRSRRNTSHGRGSAGKGTARRDTANINLNASPGDQVVVESSALVKAKKRANEVIANHRALRSFAKHYLWFNTLMAYVLEHKLRQPERVNTGLEQLHEEEAKRIGSALAITTITSISPTAAVDEWILKYPALQKLNDDEEWFRPLMDTIVVELLSDISWGLKLRVGVGAILSVMDILTDIYMIVFYLDEELGNSKGMALVTGVCIGVSTVLQLCFVVAQNKGNPRSLLQEALWVLIGVKPVIDAFRVGTGTAQKSHHIADPLTELIVTKCAEMFGESIPVGILQLAFELQKGTFAPSALLSIFVSACTTAFIASTMAYDMDSDPKSRKKDKKHFGYIPDSGEARAVSFMSMLCFKSCHVSMKFLGTAMLFCACTTAAEVLTLNTFVMLLVAEVLVYLLYKVIMCDFAYWYPLKGVSVWIISFIFRVVWKVIADYTALIHLSLPLDLGGVYYTFNTLYCHFSCYLWAYLYLTYAVVEEGGTKLEGDTVYPAMAVLTSLWLVSGLTFVKTMKPGYWRNFFSFVTAHQMVKDIFLTSEDPAIKVCIFEYNERYYMSIQNDLTRWVVENYQNWQKQAWFTPFIRSSIPANLVLKSKKPMLSANEYRAGEIGEENSDAVLANKKRGVLSQIPSIMDRKLTKRSSSVGPGSSSTFTTKTLNFGNHINTGADYNKASADDFLVYGDKR